MTDGLREIVQGKRVGILGFGLEGQSTYRFLKTHFKDLQIAIADRDESIMGRFATDLSDKGVRFHTGEGYLDALTGIEILFKSPGILLPSSFKEKNPGTLVTSQTGILLSEYRRQVIGITGTKGKSTTSSLIHHILKSSGKESLLTGNIGIPFFDHLDMVTPGAYIVCELSSSQLEDIHHSPGVAVLLNLYPEHLDRYLTTENYYRSKWNIFQHQEKDDIFILYDGIPSKDLPKDIDEHDNRLLRYGTRPSINEGCYLKDDRVFLVGGGREQACCQLSQDLFLRGNHNRLNMMAAILTCHSLGVPFDDIVQAITTFHGLEHRLEYVGCYGGIEFYNDSIATIPEATIQAVETIPNIETLILGGHDRNLDYKALIDFLMDTGISNFIFIGKAGNRMLQIARENEKHRHHKLFLAQNFDEVFSLVKAVTPAGSACLLSPAASSYDTFKNFEERGRLFKKMAREL